MFNWSEFHFFEVTFYKIHILTKGQVVVVEQSVYFHIFEFNGTVIFRGVLMFDFFGTEMDF